MLSQVAATAGGVARGADSLMSAPHTFATAVGEATDHATEIFKATREGKFINGKFDGEKQGFQYLPKGKFGAGYYLIPPKPLTVRAQSELMRKPFEGEVAHPIKEQLSNPTMKSLHESIASHPFPIEDAIVSLPGCMFLAFEGMTYPRGGYREYAQPIEFVYLIKINKQNQIILQQGTIRENRKMCALVALGSSTEEEDKFYTEQSREEKLSKLQSKVIKLKGDARFEQERTTHTGAMQNQLTERMKATTQRRIMTAEKLAEREQLLGSARFTETKSTAYRRIVKESAPSRSNPAREEVIEGMQEKLREEHERKLFESRFVDVANPRDTTLPPPRLQDAVEDEPDRPRRKVAVNPRDPKLDLTDSDNEESDVVVVNIPKEVIAHKLFELTRNKSVTVKGHPHDDSKMIVTAPREWLSECHIDWE